MSETPLAFDRPSPRLGQHTAEVLAELGYAPTEIERLQGDRVVGLGEA